MFKKLIVSYVCSHLGEGPAEELAEVPPLPPSSPPPPFRVPAADITADIMALMEDRSPPPRSPFGSVSPRLVASSATSVTPFIADEEEEFTFTFG